MADLTTEMAPRQARDKGERGDVRAGRNVLNLDANTNAADQGNGHRGAVEQHGDDGRGDDPGAAS